MTRDSLFSLIGILIGVCILVVGIIFIFSPADHYRTVEVDDAAFGGDFYTEIYAAVQTLSDNTAAAANNIQELGKSLALYFGSILSCCGILVSFHFTKEFVFARKENRRTQIQDF